MTRVWRSTLSFLVLVTCVAPWACRQGAAVAQVESRVVYDETYGTLHFKALLLPPGQLTQRAAQAIGAEFVRSADLAHFSQLVIADDESELKASTLGTVPANETEASFDRTLEQLKNATGGRGWMEKPIARVIAFGGAALLSFREGGRGSFDRPGVIETVLSGDKDPTFVPFPKGRARLLVLAVESGTRPKFLNVGAFFKASDEVSCSSCKALAEFTRSLSGAKMVEVQTRQDAWFASIAYPLRFRFDPDDFSSRYGSITDPFAPPKVAEYYRKPQTYCALYEAFSCRRYGMVESQR